nr:MAG TPA: hypothetical protein [Caudoviricetes sp.]
MKTYKGFEKDMTCRCKQYEIGKMYEEEDAKACEYGMHSCEYPLDCFRYYDPAHSVFCETEADGKIDRDKDADDTKIASTKLKIGAKLDIPRLVHAAIEYTKSHTTMEHTDSNAATAGNYGAATSRGKSASGKNGLSVARGSNVRVKGGLGAILVIAEEENDCYDVKDWKAVIVDGERVKADTWYKLVDGELVECEDEDGQN